MYTGPNIEQNHLVFAIDPASGRGNRCSDLVNIYSNTDAANPSFNGGATYTDNVSNEGFATMEFTGDGENITYGTDNGSRSLYDLTIIGWWKQDSTSGPHQTVFCTSTGYQYGLKLMSYYHGQWAAWVGAAGSANVLVGSGHTIAGDDDFYCLACTRSGDTTVIQLYENGIFSTESTTNAMIKLSLMESGNTGYGTDYHSSGYHYDGNLGQVWVWNKVLSADQILAVFNATKSRYFRDFV